MYFTYILITESAPPSTYVGHCLREELSLRLVEHNAGQTPSTKANRPWSVLAYFAWPSPEQAVRFEAYLKSGSGREFIKKWLFSNPGQMPTKERPTCHSPFN